MGAAAPPATSPAAAQSREPAVASYRFVSDLESSSGIWVNPAATGFNTQIHAFGHITWDRPRNRGWRVGQYLIGLQSGVIGFGYRHDEFSSAEGEGFAQGDAYTVSVGHAVGQTGLGVSRTWRTVGDAEGSWEIGSVQRVSPELTLGVLWRDLGSPLVRGVVRPERLIGAATYSRANIRVALQLDYKLDGGDFNAFRFGVNFLLPAAVVALANAEWNGDGDFVGLTIGASILHRNIFGTAVAGTDSDLDVRTASAGARFAAPRQTR